MKVSVMFDNIISRSNVPYLTYHTDELIKDDNDDDKHIGDSIRKSNKGIISYIKNNYCLMQMQIQNLLT